jgi:hypothetical protein
MATEIKKVRRIIHYYELSFEFEEDFHASDNDQCREFFALIKQLASTKAKIRYQKIGEKAIFLQAVTIKPVEKVITGKLRCVRTDLLPEIMDTSTDEARGIETKEKEGLVETSHFVIDFSKKTKRLAFEFNQFGARITDFIYYLEQIGTHRKATTKIGFAPLVKDELKTLASRMNRCSKFIVKVHKDKIKEIEAMDKNLYSALEAAGEHYDSEYVELIYKFDYKTRATTAASGIGETIKNLIGSLISKKERIENFNILKVTAEDGKKHNKLEVFDLLVDKRKDELFVERKPKYRIVISEDILTQMQEKLKLVR